MLKRKDTHRALCTWGLLASAVFKDSVWANEPKTLSDLVLEGKKATLLLPALAGQEGYSATTGTCTAKQHNHSSTLNCCND